MTVATARRGRHGLPWGWFAVALALVVRLLHIYFTRDLPTSRVLTGDAEAYFAWGQRIAAGDWVGTQPFYQAPLYPYALAVLFRLFGDAPVAVRLLQACWGAAGVGLMYLATGRMFGRVAGTISAIMLALYPPAIFFDGIVQKASLDALLICGLLLGLAGRPETTPAVGRIGLHWSRALLIGLLAGMLVLTRENALLWLPILGVWIWRESRGGARGLWAGPAHNPTPAPDKSG